MNLNSLEAMLDWRAALAAVDPTRPASRPEATPRTWRPSGRTSHLYTCISLFLSLSRLSIFLSIHRYIYIQYSYVFTSHIFIYYIYIYQSETQLESRYQSIVIQVDTSFYLPIFFFLSFPQYMYRSIISIFYSHNNIFFKKHWIPSQILICSIMFQE